MFSVSNLSTKTFFPSTVISTVSGFISQDTKGDISWGKTGTFFRVLLIMTSLTCMATSISSISPSAIFNPSSKVGGTFTDNVLVIPLTSMGMVSKNSILFILK